MHAEEEEAENLLVQTRLQSRQAKKPIYIISYDNKFLVVQKVFTYFLTIPTVMLSLYLVAFAFNITNQTEYKVAAYLDIFYGIDIILNFFTAFIDQEQEVKYSIRLIAFNQIKSYEFYCELLATIPFGPIYIASTDIPDENFVQDILVFKLLRLYRMLVHNPFEQQVRDFLVRFLSRDSSRTEKISTEKQLNAFVTVMKLVGVTVIAIYLFGVLWYRFSIQW